MSKLEKRLVAFAIIFVLVYLGAIALTLRSRLRMQPEATRLESALPGREEGHLLLAELLLPMLILLTISICFIIAKKKRAKGYATMEKADRSTITEAKIGSSPIGREP